MMLIEHIKSDQKTLKEMLKSFGYRVYQIDINILAVHETDKIEINT